MEKVWDDSGLETQITAKVTSIGPNQFPIFFFPISPLLLPNRGEHLSLLFWICKTQRQGTRGSPFRIILSAEILLDWKRGLMLEGRK